LAELFRESEFYQLEGLSSMLKVLLREHNTVSQSDIALKFIPGGGNFYSDCANKNFNVSYHSKSKITFKDKSLVGLSFSSMLFLHSASFVNCDLTNSSFRECCFLSDVIFEDCILDNTTFSYTNGLVNNSHKVSFSGSKTDKTNFRENRLRNSLQSSGKIP